MAKIEIKLVNGIDETADNKLLPTGALKEAKNVTIKKNGQAVIRDGFSKVTYSGTNAIPNAVIPHQLKGAVAKEGYIYRDYQRTIEANGLEVIRDISRGGFAQFRVTDNSKKGSQFGVGKSSKSVISSQSDVGEERVYSFDISAEGVLLIERYFKDTFEHDTSWSYAPVRSTSPIVPWDAEFPGDSLSIFSDLSVRAAYPGFGNNEAVIYATGFIAGNQTTYLGQTMRLDIIIRADLNKESPTGGSWDIAGFSTGTAYDRPDSFEVESSVAVTSHREPSSQAIWVAIIPDGNLASWFSFGSDRSVTLVSRTGPSLSDVRLEGDRDGRIWSFSDATSAPQWIDPNIQTTMQNAQLGGGSISTDNAKLLIDYYGDGVLRGIFAGETDDQYVLVATGGNATGLTFDVFDVPEIGGNPSSNTILSDDKTTFIFTCTREENLSDREIFDYVNGRRFEVLGDVRSPEETLQANVNRQTAFFGINIQTGGAPEVYPMGPILSANVAPNKNRQAVFIDGGDGELNAFYQQYLLATSSEVYKYRLEEWQPITASLRNEECFALGAHDIVFGPRAVDVGSIWAPPLVSAERLYDIVSTGIADCPKGTPATRQLGDAGKLRYFVVLEHTDLQGRTIRSAPAYGLIEYRGVFFEDETFKKSRAGFWVGEANIADEGYRDLFEFSVTVPAMENETLVVKLYAQDFVPFVVKGELNGDGSNEYVVDAEIDTSTGPFLEVASTIVKTGKTTKFNWGPQLEEKSVTDTSDPSSNYYSYESAATFGEPIYTTSEAPNSAAPQGSVIGRTRNRFFRNAYDGASHIYASKLLFDNKKPEWSLQDGFRIDFPSQVVGMGGIDTMLVVLTRHGVFAVRGDGPSDGGNGAFNSPQEIPGTIGCISTKSVLNAPDGVFFQSERGIYLINRGFSSPQWVGEPIRDRVTPDHICTGSAYTARDDTCRWSFTSDDEDIIVSFDRRIGQWFVQDTTEFSYPDVNIGESGPYKMSIAQVTQGADESECIGLVSSEVPFLAEQAWNEVSGVKGEIVSGELRMAGINGHWQGRWLYLLGEKKANTTVSVALSYDGVDFSKYVQNYDLTNLAEGTCQLKLTLPIQKFDTLSIKVSWDSIQGGSYVLNGMTLYYEEFEYGARLGRGYRG